MTTIDAADHRSLIDGGHAARARVVFEAVAEARRLLIVTGAETSIEAGIAERGPSSTDDEARATSRPGFVADPVRAWRCWNDEIAIFEGASPTIGHRALHDLRRKMKGTTLATLNVDGLHRRAGCEDVLEMNGHLRSATCTGCGRAKRLIGPIPLEDVRHGCGGAFKPPLVRNGAPRSASAFAPALVAAREADVILLVGMTTPDLAVTTLLAARHRGAFVVEIGRKAREGEDDATTTLPYPASRVLVEMHRFATEMALIKKSNRRRTT